MPLSSRAKVLMAVQSVAALLTSLLVIARAVGAALVGIGAMAVTTLTSLALARRRSSETNP